MLIIFDLDDTLVDTSGCWTFHQLEIALLEMQKAGLKVVDFAAALQTLRDLDRSCQNTEEALLKFVEADPHFFAIGMQEIYEKDFPHLPLIPLEGAVETLLELSTIHQLALVSNGIEWRQREKLKKAGIDSQVFSKIAISEDKNKKIRYQSVMEGLGFSPSEVVVCGDRIEVDLIPAKELGFTTVQMRWGREAEKVGEKRWIDHAISSLSEIKLILR